VSNICRFLPKLTVNGQFMRDFMAEESPCFALGLVEERKQTCGFLALRPAEVIPPEISGLGFNLGHALLGTTEFEVIQFVFHFYGFEIYNMLVNPNNREAKEETTTTGDGEATTAAERSTLVVVVFLGVFLGVAVRYR
jgi:hypothetical protein